MKRFMVFLCIIILLTPTLSACKRQVAPPQRTETEIELAQEFLAFFINQNYNQAANMFSRELRSQLPANKLEDAWKSLVLQLGQFISSGEPETQVQPPHTIVHTPMEFASGSLRLRLVFNPQKEIAGIHFTEPQIISRYTPAPYIDHSKFTEREVVIGTGDWSLPGTLSIPNGPGYFPAVVLVHGSGPNDRDETILHNKPFRDIAQGLASKGIIVLRYDKRTFAHGAKLNLDTVTPQTEVVDDAVLAAQLLLNQPEVKSNAVFVLGHSLGGYLAPRILESLPELSGAIILAGPSRGLEDSVLEQYRYLYNLDGELSSIEKQHIKELEAQVNRVKQLKPSSTTAANLLPLGLPAQYWLYLRDNNPLLITAKLNKPMLVLQGEKDYQVTMVDFSQWQELNPQGITTKSYPQLNHLFMTSAASGLSTPDEYAVPNNVSEQVIIDIAEWIKSN